jgi:hypothetical protein
LNNLYVSEQQYVYARGSVIVAINNDEQQAQISWETDLADGKRLHDRLGVTGDVVVSQRKLKVSLPKRSVAIFTED